jgi:hypothetical protein
MRAPAPLGTAIASPRLAVDCLIDRALDIHVGGDRVILERTTSPGAALFILPTASATPRQRQAFKRSPNANTNTNHNANTKDNGRNKDKGTGKKERVGPWT